MLPASSVANVGHWGLIWRTEDRRQRTEDGGRRAKDRAKAILCPLSSVLCPLTLVAIPAQRQRAGRPLSQCGAKMAALHTGGSQLAATARRERRRWRNAGATSCAPPALDVCGSHVSCPRAASHLASGGSARGWLFNAMSKTAPIVAALLVAAGGRSKMVGRGLRTRRIGGSRTPRPTKKPLGSACDGVQDKGQRTKDKGRRESHPLSFVFCPLSFHTGARPDWPEGGLTMAPRIWYSSRGNFSEILFLGKEEEDHEDNNG